MDFRDPLVPKGAHQLELVTVTLEGLEKQRQNPFTVPSTPERREGLRACYWEGPSELPERRSSSSAPGVHSNSRPSSQ